MMPQMEINQESTPPDTEQVDNNKETAQPVTVVISNGSDSNGHLTNEIDQHSQNERSEIDDDKNVLPNDGMCEVGLEPEDDEQGFGLLRRNSESEVGLNGRLSRCTTETQSMKSDSDVDISSDENCANRLLQLRLLTLERRLTEVNTALTEEKERRICDLSHFQNEKAEMLGKIESLVKDLEKMKKDKEAAVMKYAKSEHEAITATKAKEATERKLADMTRERDAYIARVRLLNHDYSRLQSRLEARGGDLNKLERIIDRLLEEKNKAQMRLQDLEKYCDKLLTEQQQELARTSTEFSNEMTSKLDEVKNRLTECQNERDELYQSVQHLEDANRAHHENLSLSQMEIERLKAGLEQANEDHANCANREAESLQFVQQLTERTLKSQAENEQLKAQVSLLKEDVDTVKEKNFTLEHNYTDASERLRVSTNECKCLRIRLSDIERERDLNERRVRELEHEKSSLKRKNDQNVKQLSKELQIARKKLEELDSNEQPQKPSTLQLDQKVLVERIVKLQKNLARKSEKIEFLEEHVKELTGELSRKHR